MQQGRAPHRARRAPSPISAWRKLMFGLLTTLCALLGLELGARAVDVQGPRWRGRAQGDLMVSHPTRLWALAPGAHRSGDAVARVGPDGLRGPALSAPGTGSGPRVLVLGDSSFFGHGVAEDQTLPAQLQRRLQLDGINAQVQNFAVPGYSTVQGRALLDEQGWAAAPDLLLLGFLWSDNNIDGFRDADLLATRRLLDDSRLSRSRAFLLLTSLVSHLRGEGGARVVSWTASSAFPSKGQRRVPLVAYAQNLDAMARAAAQRGVGVAFIAPVNQDMLGSAQGGDKPVWDVYFQAQAVVAAHHGVPCIALAPAYSAAGTAPESLFVDVMHPSAQGHQIGAGAVTAALRAAGWPAQRLVPAGGALDLARLPADPFVGAPLPHAHRSPQHELFGGTGAPDPTMERPAAGVDLHGRR